MGDYFYGLVFLKEGLPFEIVMPDIVVIAIIKALQVIDPYLDQRHCYERMDNEA